MAKTVQISLGNLIVYVILGLCIILTIGLISGFTKNTTCPQQTYTGSPTKPNTVSGGATRTVPGLTTKVNPTAGPTTAFAPSEFRLSPNIKPVRNDILLRTYFDPYGSKLDDEKYTGEVSLVFNLTLATNRIVFHMDLSVRLTDINIQFTNELNNQNIAVQSHNYLRNQLYEVVLASNLPVGTYRIFMKFEGRTSSNGFYKISYLENFTERTMLANNFLPNKARYFIPCFDEPSYKSSYQITIEHPSRSIALSNFPAEAPVIFQESGQSRKRTKFQPTVPMSVYLVSLVVVPDDYGMTTINQNGVNINIHARKSEINLKMAEYAKEVAEKSLIYFIDYFNTKEPVPTKIDLIAIPGFPGGSASPNWGLNQFHEDNILFSPDENSLLDKQNIALRIAQELASYWVGNYVTCAWWDDLWLNEGFANFFSYKAIHNKYPEYDIENQFITEETIKIMWEDGFVTSKPVIKQVDEKNSVPRTSDPVIVSKGAAILRMLESIVSETGLRNSMRNYISSKPFGSVKSQDFYDKITLPSNLGVSSKDYLERYLLQKNYPVVDVLLQRSPGDGKASVKFIQDRFLLTEIDEDYDGPSPFGYKWMIHLQCKAGGTLLPDAGLDEHLVGIVKEFEYFLKDSQGEYQLDREYTWIKCNKNFNGFYVTDYFDRDFEAFEKLIKNNDDDQYFSTADRVNLIHVAFELAFLGSKSYKIPSMLIEYLETVEARNSPWQTFFWHINKIMTITEHRPSFKNLRDFSIRLVKQIAMRLDVWEVRGTHEDNLLKVSLIEFLCRVQEEQCILKATELFKTIPSGYFIEPENPKYNNTVHPNYRLYVYKYHMQNTNDFLDWIRLYEFYEITQDEREKDYAVEALANTRAPWIFDLYLSAIFDPNTPIKKEDMLKIIKYVGANPNGRYFAWYFIREFYLEFGASKEIYDVIFSICSSFDNQFLFEEMYTFFESTYEETFIERRLQIELTIINNIYWVADRESDFAKFFFAINKNKLIA